MLSHARPCVSKPLISNWQVGGKLSEFEDKIMWAMNIIVSYPRTFIVTIFLCWNFRLSERSL